MFRSLIHGDSGLGKTKLAETLRNHVVEDDGCEWMIIEIIAVYDVTFAIGVFLFIN